MYGMGPAMYFVMARFQLPLPQATTLPLRPNKEAKIMDKVNFNTIGPWNMQKGDL
jgi:hypothetical protein